MLGLNAEPFALAELPGVTLPGFPQDIPEFGLKVPGCPVGLPALWGSVAKTTPADESSRQVPIVMRATMLFISELPFKTMWCSDRPLQRNRDSASA